MSSPGVFELQPLVEPASLPPGIKVCIFNFYLILFVKHMNFSFITEFFEDFRVLLLKFDVEGAKFILRRGNTKLHNGMIKFLRTPLNIDLSKQVK